MGLEGELLGELALLLLEALPPGVVVPPEAEPDLAGSFAGSVALGDVGPGVAAELPAEGEVLAEEELEPALEGGVDGVVEALPLALPLVLAPGAVAGRSVLSPQAARPRARAAATAMLESLMCPPWLGLRKSSKERAGLQASEIRGSMPGALNTLL